MAVNGPALAALGMGVVLAWSAVQNKSILSTVQDIVSGKKPTPGPTSNNTPAGTPESGGAASQINVTTPGSGTDAANEALAHLMAGGYGWATGANWQALKYGWGTLESGFNANAMNASGAYGIAQALGHGTAQTQGTKSNSYGPDNGVSVATAKAANSGSATAQIAWGLAYIKATYGSPSQVPGWLGQGGYGGY